MSIQRSNRDDNKSGRLAEKKAEYDENFSSDSEDRGFNSLHMNSSRLAMNPTAAGFNHTANFGNKSEVYSASFGNKSQV